MESRTQKFINDYINEKYGNYIMEISIYQFDNEIEKYKPKVQRAYQVFDKYSDVRIHPLQLVYVLNNNKSSYPSGLEEWNFEMVFKYRGKYYLYVDSGSN